MADMLDGIRVGDFVRTTARVDPNGTILFPIGTVARVVEIRNSHPLGLNFKLETPDDYWNYSRDMLIPLVNSAQTNEENIMVKIIEELKLVKDKIKLKGYCAYPNDDDSRVVPWNDICDVIDESVSSMVTRYVKTQEE